MIAPNNEFITELKLDLLQAFTVENFVDEILCIHEGRKAVILNLNLRKIFIADAESGEVVGVSFGHLSKRFKNEPFDDTQKGASFLYKQGFGIVYDDMILLFEDPNSIEYKIVPISNPLRRELVPGIPKPNNVFKAFYQEETNRLYLLFDQMQARKALAFFSVIVLSESSAAFEFQPRHFEFPETHPEFNHHVDFNKVNNFTIPVTFLMYQNELVLASYGRAFNLSFGKTPKRIYFSTLNESFQGKEIRYDFPNNYTNCVITSDSKFIGWVHTDKAKKDTLLLDLETKRQFRINLKSKKNNFERFDPRTTGIFNLSHHYFWYSNGGDAVNCYRIKNEYI